MNSFFLVFLALIAGAAAGAGLTVFSRDSARGGPAPSLAPTTVATAKSGIQGKPDETAKPEQSEEYRRLAKAILAMDERLALMEARGENTMDRQNKLLDGLRELAIQLEVRAGALEPLRPGTPTALEPLRPSAEPPVADVMETRPVPMPARPVYPVPQEGVPVGMDELPEW